MPTAQFKERIISKLIDLVLIKASYGKISGVFTSAKLHLTTSERGTLKNHINALLTANSPDIFGFATFLKSIDFDLARRFYQERKERKRHKRARKLAKRKKSLAHSKGYQAPQRRKVSAAEILVNNKDRVKIGLGLESITTIKRIKADEVVLDKNTDKLNIKDKSILYAAGWSIEGAFTKK
jgi:hypothetical protein